MFSSALNPASAGKPLPPPPDDPTNTINPTADTHMLLTLHVCFQVINLERDLVKLRVALESDPGSERSSIEEVRVRSISLCTLSTLLPVRRNQPDIGRHTLN